MPRIQSEAAGCFEPTTYALSVMLSPAIQHHCFTGCTMRFHLS